MNLLFFKHIFLSSFRIPTPFYPIYVLIHTVISVKKIITAVLILRTFMDAATHNSAAFSS